MGLLAEPVKAVPVRAPARVSRDYDRAWPSEAITLSRTRPRRDGSVPNRSLADYNWRLTSLTGQKSIEDTIAKLLEVSENARQRAARGDAGYARITVEKCCGSRGEELAQEQGLSLKGYRKQRSFQRVRQTVKPYWVWIWSLTLPCSLSPWTPANRFWIICFKVCWPEKFEP
jgi:hypothetical protein